MPEPENFSSSVMGGEDLFRTRLAEGYTGVAFGRGDWVDFTSMNIHAFYHPDGRIRIYVQSRKMTCPMRVIMGIPSEAELTESQFQEFLDIFQIKLGQKNGLAELVERLEE